MGCIVINDNVIEDKKLNLSKYLEVIIESSIDWNSKNVDEFIELCWQETNNIFSTITVHALHNTIALLTYLSTL